MASKDFSYFCPKCKKLKNKPNTTNGTKRKSYDAIDFLVKQPKKSKKRFDPSQYNFYGPSNYDPNDISNKSPKLTEEMIPFDLVLSSSTSLTDLKRLFYEMPFIKLPGNNKKTTNGHPQNESSYNSIDHLMSTYG